MLQPAEVAAIERATIAAVAPAQVHELDGWLVPVDAGTIGRAKAAVPLRHDVPLVVGLIDQVEALYRAAGVAPAFRLADDPRLQPVADELARRGYRPEQPTLVKTGDPAGLIALGATAAGLAAAPDASWAQVFAGDGFDPADAAHRLRNFRRSPDAVFASV
ncbi:MAG: acetyltransferase, family, partial [Phenylobacterium sp.]|nr:acetyltransferase, family [Phenylobacterium sp.]